MPHSQKRTQLGILTTRFFTPQSEHFVNYFTAINNEESSDDFADSSTPVDSEVAQVCSDSTISDPQEYSDNETNWRQDYVEPYTTAVSHEKVIKAAERVVKRFNKSYDEPEDFHYLRGPSRKTRLARYPPLSQALPPDWSLTELCKKYPNHLTGMNLIPFLQHDWNPYQIVDMVKTAEPAQITMLTSQTIIARMKSLRAVLGPRLEEYLDQPCKHKEYNEGADSALDAIDDLDGHPFGQKDVGNGSSSKDVA